MSGPLPADVLALLGRTRTIAVVGASEDSAKAAHRIPARLVAMGYRVLPVNPRGGRILGIDAFRSLGDLAATHPDPVDLVDVFRPARDCVAVAEAAVRIGARALWLQQGIVSPAARALAEAAGMDYVEDRCLAVDVALALRTGSIPPLPSAEDAP